MPLSPDPTEMDTAPPLPPVACPDPIYIAPLLPSVERPVLKMTFPLTPLVPPSAVAICTYPLLAFKPAPLCILTLPPVLPSVVVVAPEMIRRSPPVPLSPDPTEMDTTPPLPPVACPDPIYIAPLSPSVASPVLTERTPLTPAVPPSSVATNISPLEVK